MMIGHKHITEAVAFTHSREGVGEHCTCAEVAPARGGGAVTNENVGISNENAGEKPARRKTKVSPAMLVSRGSVGT